MVKLCPHSCSMPLLSVDFIIYHILEKILIKIGLPWRTFLCYTKQLFWWIMHKKSPKVSMYNFFCPLSLSWKKRCCCHKSLYLNGCSTFRSWEYLSTFLSKKLSVCGMLYTRTFTIFCNMVWTSINFTKIKKKKIVFQA